jgi:UDP-N-acetylmuramoyl-tripeptide--D-alanyl-D-alanine ligase
MGSNGTVWHLSHVLQATGGELARLDGSRHYAGVSTDTRRLQPGEIFVALRGPNHDGHGFLAEAAQRGAAAVIVERGSGASLGGDNGSGAALSVIEVADTLWALGDLAAYERRRRGYTVAAITGSNGKTTTKEMLASIMAKAVGASSVLRTTGTENNLIGLPLTLLRAAGTERVAVLELGMNIPGEIWRLTEIADPDVGVVTSIAPAHIEGLGDIEGVARAKGELYRRLRPSATAIVNHDDARVCEIAESFSGRTMHFGTGGEVAAERVESRGVDGVEFTLVIAGERRPVYLPLPGCHNVTNALAASALAHALGAPMDAIVTGLTSLPPLPMRMQIETLPGDITVINDAYNANPASMRSALTMLGGLGAGTKIAVLGEMRELGAASATLHRQVGRYAAEQGVDVLIAVGPQASELCAGAVEGGVDPAAAFVGESRADAIRIVRERVRAGDVVLVKGSRGARMEEVVVHLREDA